MSNFMPLLVLSAGDVSALAAALSAESICAMMGKTMAAISGPAADKLAIQNPQRITTESEMHKTLYMPSRLTTAEGPATAIKVVGVPKPECPRPGLPATTLLLDEVTGLPRACVNAAELTGLRTAAVSALATKILADPASSTLVIFGSGSQAYYHARLILQLFPAISSAAIVVRALTARAEALVAQLRSEFSAADVRVVTSEQADGVVQDADIICTCVPSHEPVFSLEALKPGVHINAIGSYTPSMREFPPSLVGPVPVSDDAVHIPTFLVDSAPACLAEAGELIAASVIPSQLVEIGTLLDPQSGALRDDEQTKARRTELRAKGRSLFKCVGVGGMDVAITRLVVAEAERSGVGMRVPF